MTLTAAIENLRDDLERYAASGKASAKALAMRTTILNALIDGFNELEERLVEQQERFSKRIRALENDLAHRDRVIGSAAGKAFVDMDWSWLEGRAQAAIQYKRNQLDHEEGKSIGPEDARKERRLLDLLEHELNTLYDAEMMATLRHGQLQHKYNALLGWMVMHGLDAHEWSRIPPEWYIHIAMHELETQHKPSHSTPRINGPMPEAVQIALDRRLIDGLDALVPIDAGNERIGYVRQRLHRSYRNPGAVAYNILQAVVHEHRHSDVLRAAGLPIDPEREPMWAWPSALETKTPEATPAFAGETQ